MYSNDGYNELEFLVDYKKLITFFTGSFPNHYFPRKLSQNSYLFEIVTVGGISHARSHFYSGNFCMLKNSWYYKTNFVQTIKRNTKKQQKMLLKYLCKVFM